MTEPTDDDILRDVIAVTTAVDGDDMEAAEALVGVMSVARMSRVLMATACFLGRALDELDERRPPEAPPLLMEYGLAWAERGQA